MGLSSELACASSLVLAAAAAFAATPVAITAARRSGFLDVPVGYKAHRVPTPYLGGAAVLVGYLAGSLTFGHAATTYGLITICALGLWALGTLDDRRPVAPRWRLLAEIAAAEVLIQGDLDWAVSSIPAMDELLTIAWVVAVVNAFNLMDNIDGAASTVAAASSAGVAILALVEGDTALSALSFAICGASLGFLPWNLAGPARVFLGDGGSMLLGFLVACATMRLSHVGGSDPSALPVGLLLVGLPAFDVALVTYSRRRRGLPIVTGGRDHLTHRLLGGLRSPRRVGATLAVAQGTLALVAIGGHELAGGTIWFVGAGCVAVALVLIPLLESQFPAAVTDRRHRVESETFPMGRDEGPLTPARAANDPTP